MSGPTTDTIAAIATPSGRGGVGIIRLSGPESRAIACALSGVQTIKSRFAHYCRFRDADGEILDDGLMLFFAAPASFTGEDVVEFQGHGGPVLMDMLLSRVLSLGARPARAGEFSERAFLNDKLDLAQAEAIADLIDSSSEEAARAARRSLDGDFSRGVHAMVAETTALRVYVEAAIDFPDEEVDFLSDGKILKRIDALDEQLAEIQQKAGQGRLLREGVRLVITGRPNAGKSSLLNALARYEAAIVTEIPGTTRDVLREEIQIEGMPLHVIDTAGIRETDDPVEQEGVRRAWRELEQADLVLMLVDAREGWTDEDQQSLDNLPEGLPVTLIENKIDLLSENDRETTRLSSGFPALPKLSMSAKHGRGLDDLHRRIVEEVGRQAGETGTFSARRRHLDALEQARTFLLAAREQLTVFAAGELVAEELRGMQDALGEITGTVTPDDLLGEIFSSFCIGK